MISRGHDPTEVQRCVRASSRSRCTRRQHVARPCGRDTPTEHAQLGQVSLSQHEFRSGVRPLPGLRDSHNIGRADAHDADAVLRQASAGLIDVPVPSHRRNWPQSCWCAPTYCPTMTTRCRKYRGDNRQRTSGSLAHRLRPRRLSGVTVASSPWPASAAVRGRRAGQRSRTSGRPARHTLWAIHVLPTQSICPRIPT